MKFSYTLLKRKSNRDDDLVFISSISSSLPFKEFVLPTLKNNANYVIRLTIYD
jgi:hypothetical protein